MASEQINIPYDELAELCNSGDLTAVARLLEELHPTDIATALDGLKVEDSDILEIFRLLPNEIGAETLLEMEGELRELLVDSVSHAELGELVYEMETDDVADIVAELHVDDAEKVLEGMDYEESEAVRELLKYPEDTAGGKMQTELVAVSAEATVSNTLADIREKAKEVDHFTGVFAVDVEGHLVGTVPLDKLILADPGTVIKDITDIEAPRVTVDVDQEEVAKMFSRYDLLSMPVVDHEDRVVGRITIDDVVDVIEEEIFEDFYRVASLNAEERSMDSALRSFKLRAPWLLINVMTAFVAASVVKVFQGTIESMVILAVFMPVVAGLGGNAATQAITVMVRGLALGEMNLKHTRRLIVKEALVGLSNGLLVGVAAACISYFFSGNLMIGLLLFLAMTANLVIAGVCGSFIPLLLKWLGVDPALSSSVFVTACTDIGGFFTFLGLATMFLKTGLL
ncbi:Mg/Co/Ni transporter MgtE, CBS domain-containing [hydrothermal vent metagenome]|uniref:Mg/Co/Ni transporter MgtE, CBS domain-containing n=1 Tax=hydrothermal vent metagenome TaxID=652676 RepID=A0A3B0R546_9ZZZZ